MLTLTILNLKELLYIVKDASLGELSVYITKDDYLGEFST